MGNTQLRYRWSTISTFSWSTRFWGTSRTDKYQFDTDISPPVELHHAAEFDLQGQEPRRGHVVP
ncbi:hypothetical protein ACRAWD_30050 [Caulobacter segnis]